MAERAGYEIVVVFTFVVCATYWLVFHSQFKAALPEPLRAEDAGETGFYEVAAVNHVKAAALVCGRDKWFDFVTFSVTYSCWTEPTTKIPGWNKTQIPALRVGRDDFEGDDNRATLIHINTAGSTRWSLSVNTNEIQDFQLQDDSGVLVSGGEKKSIDGWHLLHFAGGKNWATKFDMTLHWHKNSSSAMKGSEGGNVMLLKLRTHNVNATTLEMHKVLENLPFLVFSVWELHFTTYLSLLGYFVCYFCFRAFVENGDFTSFSTKCVIVSPLDCD